MKSKCTPETESNNSNMLVKWTKKKTTKKKTPFTLIAVTINYVLILNTFLVNIGLQISLNSVVTYSNDSCSIQQSKNQIYNLKL